MRSNGYFRSKERNRRLKNLYDKTKFHYGCGVWFNEEKDRLIRYYKGKRSKSYSNYLKKQSNKQIRRIKDDNFQRGQYKKVFDLWWELY